MDIGEEVRVRLHERFGRFKAEVIEWVSRSSRRVSADCEQATFCPGCSLRHLSPTSELEHKIANRAARLEAQGIAVPAWDNIYVSPRNDIRSRAVLRAFSGATGSLQLGMRAWTGDTVIGLDGCPVQTLACRTLIERTQTALQALGIRAYDPQDRSGHLRHVIIEALPVSRDRPAEPQSRIILAFGHPGSAALIPSYFMAEIPGLVVATDILPFRGAGLISKPQALNGDGRIYGQLGEDRFRISLGAWAPQTPSSVQSLCATALQWLDPTPTDQIIEAGCGIGTLSLPLARKSKQLIGIDMSRPAIQDAQFNAISGRVENVQFITGRAEHSLRKLAAKQTPCDLALVHAMRKPMGKKAMAGLNVLRPKKILYIAPQMSSFIEDLKALHGYTVERIGSIDQTPATGHLLTLSLLVCSQTGDLPAAKR